MWAISCLFYSQENGGTASEQQRQDLTPSPGTISVFLTCLQTPVIDNKWRGAFSFPLFLLALFPLDAAFRVAAVLGRIGHSVPSRKCLAPSWRWALRIGQYLHASLHVHIVLWVGDLGRWEWPHLRGGLVLTVELGCNSRQCLQMESGPGGKNNCLVGVLSSVFAVLSSGTGLRL